MAMSRAHARDVTADNKAIVKAFIDQLLTEGDPSVLDELTSPDDVDHDPSFGATGTVELEMMRQLGVVPV